MLDFYQNTSKLKEMQELANSKDGLCLSNIYINSRNKINGNVIEDISGMHHIMKLKNKNDGVLSVPIIINITCMI